MRALRTACLLILCLSFALLAQTAQTSDTAATAKPAAIDKAQPPPPPPATGPAAANSLAEGAPNVPADLQQLVNKQFGMNFKVALQRKTTRRYLHQEEPAQEWSPLLVGDLDGDGIEDALIVAHVKNAFSGQIPFRYSVIDPYFAAFGYGNPMITAGLAEERPEQDYVILVIHGLGAEAWHNPVPKSKWVMINLPFNTINIAPMVIDKKGKQVSAIILEENGTNQSSLVVWDGKKYRWRDMGGPGE
jgi:hypothetical protein